MFKNRKKYMSSGLLYPARNSMNSPEIKSDYDSVEKFYEAMNSGSFSFFYNEKGVYENCLWSDSLRKILSYESEIDFPNNLETFLNRVVKEDRAKLFSSYKEATKNLINSKLYNVEFRIEGKDGKINTCQGVGKFFKRKDGSVCQFSGIIIKLKESEVFDTLFSEHDLEERVEQLDVLTALANSYLTLHVINLDDDYVIEYKTTHDVRQFVNQHGNANKQMKKVMNSVVVKKDREKVLEFVDFQTISDRLKGKKSLSLEFISVVNGWCRAVFVPVKYDKDENVTVVIFATRKIEEEKRREERLVLRSNTDELTGLFNRHAYEDALKSYSVKSPDDNFVFVSLDVNGLKDVNDNLGHLAGDELIKGAAACMIRVFKPYGSLYRTGGDEFAIILELPDMVTIENLTKHFVEEYSNWTGKLVRKMAISYGYVTKKEMPEFTVMEMVKLADQRMYRNKAKYYEGKGIDRRSQQAVISAISKTYTRIIKVNLKDDTFVIIHQNEELIDFENVDQTIPSFTLWAQTFAKSGNINSEDSETFLEKFNLEFLRKYFEESQDIYKVFYKRIYKNCTKNCFLEVIPSSDFSQENQNVFIGVKILD